MATTNPELVTETVILHLKPGMNIEDETSEAHKKFQEMASVIKSQEGCLSQFWGHMVESPGVFVWYINWASIIHPTNFAASPAHGPFLALVSEVFDLQREGGGMFMLLTYWTSPTTTSFKSKLTSIALHTLPSNFGDKEKSIIEEALVSVNQNVQASGAAIGFVSEVKLQPKNSTPEGHHIAVHNVCGWESVEAYEEGMKGVESIEEEKTGLEMGGVDVDGEGKGKEGFLVRFREV